MIDIHTHVLPGLDDGPANLEQSVRMLALASKGGTTDMVASPHSDLQYHYDREVVARKIAELQAACPYIQLHRGCDFHMIPERIQEALLDTEYYSINGKGYLLVEFADSAIPDATDDLLDRMVRRGLRPIITHPERNPILQRDVERIQFWVARGCYVQITGQSILGHFGRTAARVCRELLSGGLVHFVASDGHDEKHRPPVLADAYEDVAADYGDAAAEELFRINPGRALAGEMIAPGTRRWKRSRWAWMRA